MALEDPQTIKKLWRAFYAVLAVLLALEFVIPLVEHEPHESFAWAHWPEFNAVYGFVCCVLMVVVSKKVVGLVLIRPDTYYDSSPLDPTRDAKGRPLRPAAERPSAAKQEGPT